MGNKGPIPDALKNLSLKGTRDMMTGVADTRADLDTARAEVARLTAEVEAMREALASEQKKQRDEAISLIRDMTEALKKSEEDNGRLTGVVIDMEMCLREAIHTHGDGTMSVPLMRGAKALAALDALRARKVGG